MSVALPFPEVGEYRATSSGEQVMVLPSQPRRLGPVSRVLLARLVVALAVVQAAGAWLFFAHDGHAARAAGVASSTTPRPCCSCSRWCCWSWRWCCGGG